MQRISFKTAVNMIALDDEESGILCYINGLISVV